MNKRTLLIAAVSLAFLLVCCCFFVAAGAGAYFFTRNVVKGGNTALQNNATVEVLPVDPQKTDPESTSDTFGNSQIGIPDTEMLSVMRSIEKQVNDIRGLKLSSDVTRHTLSTESLRKRVLEDFFVDYTVEDSQKDAMILNLFGFLEKDYDLYNLYIDLYSEQIAGFYDELTREMVVVQGEEFSGSEKMTYAHEFTHALQDDAYDLENGLNLNDNQCLIDSEYCLAVQALVEGDATLTESLWLMEYSSTQDKKDIFSLYNDYQSPIYDSAPKFLQEDFLFPYRQGLEFAQSLHDQGGFDAINQAYILPPVSTEQILHPEHYPEDEPVSLNIPDLSETLGNGWQEIDRNSLGEWYTYLMLTAPYDPHFAIDETVAKSAVAGWGGDQYVIYQNETDNQIVLAYNSMWDSNSELEEFWLALLNYGKNRWGEPDKTNEVDLYWEQEGYVITISRFSNRIQWLLSQDPDLHERVYLKLKFFPQE
ncbi:MAG: hypothetical protein ACYDH1_15150 [Anaerolineaceae bacterium]